MALHRRAAKRDDNEPGIRSRFKFHGWHTETLSASGMPDLMVFHVRAHASGMGFEPRTYLVDVKGKDGAPTKPQREKWAALAEKGIPVYVVRAEADVDALVRGVLEPWRPEVLGSLRAPLPHGTVRREPGRTPLHNLRSPPRSGPKAGRTDYSEACCPVARPCSEHLATQRAKVREAGESMARTSVEARDEARRAHAEAEAIKGGPLRVRCGRMGCRKLLPCAEHSHNLPRNGSRNGVRRVPKGATEERARQKRHTAQYGQPTGTTAQRLASAQREYEASPHYTPPTRPANADAALADLARRYAEREDTLIAKRAAAELKRRGLTRTQPVDAAKEAAETFAPPPYHRVCEVHTCYEPPFNGRFCAEHTP